MAGTKLRDRVQKVKSKMSKPVRGGKSNLAPPSNKPHAIPKKKKNSRKNKGSKKGNGTGNSNGSGNSSKLEPKNAFERLERDVSLDLDAHNPQETNDETIDDPSTGFISLDFDDSDDAKSIHASTFKAFEEAMENQQQLQEEEEENDYVAVRTGEKRKRDHGSNHHQSINSEFPWVRNHDHSYQRETADWLTQEIRDFVVYMSPSAEEIEARNAAVRRVRNLVHELWDDAEAHVFGSYATDLYLPGSDIDMVVLSPSGRYDDRKSLYQLSARLRSRNIARNVEVLAKTRVPLIKFVDKETNIHIDISFERRNGLEAVKTIQSWLAKYPSLRYFVFVVKQLLAKRKLNEVHTGGLGGFSVICLVVSFLSNHPRVASNDIDVEDNLGVLLIEMFELYGKHFNYDEVALCMSGDMSYKLKSLNDHLLGQGPFTLAIEDPNDPTNNLSRGSFNMRAIKKAFNGAFDILASRCYELEYTPFKKRKGQSILGYLIKLRGPLRDFEDSRFEVRNESQDVLKSRMKRKAHDEPPPTKRLKQQSSSPAPDVVFISDDEDHENDTDRGFDDRKSRSENYVMIDSSDEDSDNAPDPSNDHNSESSDDEIYSRINATALDKEKKRQFWLEKSGVVAI